MPRNDASESVIANEEKREGWEERFAINRRELRTWVKKNKIGQEKRVGS